MKKILSILITLSVIFSTVPAFNITASAASVSYYETTVKNADLRNEPGFLNTVVSVISSKNTVVKFITSEKPGILTWFKVKVPAGTTSNGASGEYWMWAGSATKHKHNMVAGACSFTGCDYEETIKTIDSEKITVEVTKKNAPMRSTPYNDGKTIEKLNKGQLLTVTNKVQNYQGEYWYKIKNGCYIYKSNVKVASQKKIEAQSNNINNSGESSSAITDFFDHIIEIIPCLHLSRNLGKCVNCGNEWKLNIESVSGTYRANKNTSERTVPYKKAPTTGKTYNSGDIVPVIGRAKNSSNERWYRTADGWVYDVGDVSLKEVKLNLSGYTFNDLNTTLTPKLTVTPGNAAIKSVVWESSKPQYVSVDFVSGKITPIAAGRSTVTCTVTAEEGTVKKAKLAVSVTEEATLENWQYAQTSFSHDLALKCSIYSALAYPHYNYSQTVSGTPDMVYKSTSKSKEPDNLTKLLQKEGFSYKVSENYHNKTRNNSPYVLAHKYVKFYNKKTPLVYVIIEGTAGRPGWEGNMMITGSEYADLDEHKTFEASAENIKEGLTDYMNNNKIEKPIVVITGHSRGAGAGNLLAAKLYNTSGIYERVYAYLFATPNTTKNPIEGNYIYNICNEGDFVPYIPLSSSGWGYKKHGKMVYFDSAELQKNKNAYSFNNYTKKLFNMSEDARNPDYNWTCDTPNGMRDYMAGTWKTIAEYYKHNSNTYTECDMEAFDYFFNGVAPAASGGEIQIILDHIHPADLSSCPFTPISWFLGFNGLKGGTFSTFRDSHEMMTYHAAIQTMSYEFGEGVHIFSEPAYGNGTVALNQEEHDALYEFFNQSENKLMLEVAGWDIEDSSTWEGTKWNTDGNIVSIDLSYLNLDGWFNANSFPKLQDLNIDGNDISMLAVSECSELVNLSCMANDLSSLTVNECGSLQNLHCGFNQISSLDVSDMSQLSELNCYGNQISDLNLSGATALQTVRCGNNELYTVDISTNTSLNTFYCDNNNIVGSQNTELLNSINAINADGGSAIIGTQKYNENYAFNPAELSSLTDFANMSLNLEKLGWDLDNPYTWQGVEWKIIGDEYHVTAINFDGLELEGDFNLPEAEYVESVSLEDSSLTTLNLAGCTGLNTLNCYNSGISSLEIENCSSLTNINCDENYLEIEDVESSLSQIGLSTGIATYETQNIAADEETFNESEREVLIGLLSTGNNADILGWDWNWPGTWDGIVWTNADGEYRVNKIDFADKAVCGDIDLSSFEYLEDFNFSGSQIETVILPDCITTIPEYAFYNSDIKYIHMSEGVTNIEKSAFAQCKNLNTVVLPSTVTRIMDNAFYESSNLKNLVFIGNEPAEVGNEIAHGASSEFNILFFNDAVWNGTSELMNVYSYASVEDEYIVLLDETVELKDDTYYHETNNYAGDDVNVTVISKTPGNSAACLLAVYDESGKINEIVSSPTEMNRYMTVTSFEDINVQYAGEEYCIIKAFLWSNLNSVKPLTTAAERVLIKPDVE